MMGARAASILSDGLVLALTAIKTFNRARGADLITGKGPIIKQILLRDTVLCFGLLCIVNVVGIATGHLDQFIEVLQVWTATLTSILLSRLALDLREASAAEEGNSGEFFSRTLRNVGYAIPDEYESSDFTASGENAWELELSELTSSAVKI
ncbi:hypothetical protein EVJ58_g7378 [Rhodofomes roseus]|uniref:Uncharacterized protein n=1 Tax=Rhodofomes roseus TaxID=34475 RepID=A0A4Y9Y3B5_9APHY|nr:hypothetical protein EVJ58_g7378 [Rhodofomes roseus]